MTRHVRLIIAATALIIFCVWITACNSDSASYDNKELQELEKVLGVRFPADAKIVFSAKNDRNNEIYYNHIVHTRQPVMFPGLTALKMPADSPVEVLKNAVSVRKLIKLKDKYTYTYEGTYKSGEWQAYQTNFDSGSYLDVKQIYF
ncbi:MAG: hypothetical protein PVG41_16950 [Desulfobacteraceae bacterium]